MIFHQKNAQQERIVSFSRIQALGASLEVQYAKAHAWHLQSNLNVERLTRRHQFQCLLSPLHRPDLQQSLRMHQRHQGLHRRPPW